nr:exopolysaccharide biosynthesis protein [Pseudoxanthomonas kalamensis]
MLDELAVGDPAERLPLSELMTDLRQSAFGMLLFVAVLPSFIPVPGAAGMISGPLVILVGLQLLLGLRRPWLPRFIGRHGPQRQTMQRYGQRLSRMLGWLERLVRPRLEFLLDHRLASAFTGLQLILLGLLLALPIPFTNYIFGGLLLLYVFALLERDGALMLVAWLAGLIAIGVFGFATGNLLQMLVAQFQTWF